MEETDIIVSTIIVKIMNKVEEKVKDMHSAELLEDFYRLRGFFGVAILEMMQGGGISPQTLVMIDLETQIFSAKMKELQDEGASDFEKMMKSVFGGLH